MFDIIKNLFILLLFIIIVILSYFLIICKNKDNFCGACQDMDKKVCTNRQLLHQLYNNGYLTEYTTDNSMNKNWKDL